MMGGNKNRKYIRPSINTSAPFGQVEQYYSKPNSYFGHKKRTFAE